MNHTEKTTTDTDSTDKNSPSTEELEDATVSAIRECEENSDTIIDGAPREAVVDALQDKYDINEKTALETILDVQIAGRAYMTNGSDHPDQPHIRAPDEPDSNEDSWDDIDPSEAFPSTPEEMGIPSEEVKPDPPDEESQPVREEPDYIVDEDNGDREPEFPGIMSSESIRLRGDEDEEWREPRSLY